MRWLLLALMIGVDALLHNRCDPFVFFVGYFATFIICCLAVDYVEG